MKLHALAVKFWIVLLFVFVVLGLVTTYIIFSIFFILSYLLERVGFTEAIIFWLSVIKKKGNESSAGNH